MTAQTSYTINQRTALAGLVYDLNPKDVISRLVETAAGIGFGLAVSRGTDATRQCVLGGTSYLGVTVRSLEREGDNAAGDIEYKDESSAAIMRKGYVWANCTDACVPGNAVNYVHATGKLGSGVGTGGGETTITGASWESTAAAGGLAILRLA